MIFSLIEDKQKNKNKKQKQKPVIFTIPSAQSSRIEAKIVQGTQK